MHNNNTYCEGPDIISDEPFTTKDICKLCGLLNKNFGEGYEFKPGPITERDVPKTERGIQMTTWPGKK